MSFFLHLLTLSKLSFGNQRFLKKEKEKKMATAQCDVFLTTECQICPSTDFHNELKTFFIFLWEKGGWEDQYIYTYVEGQERVCFYSVK